MWTADKIYFQGSSAYTRAYQGSELVWEYVPPIYTKKFWWNGNATYQFILHTKWNNGYRVEVDQYFTSAATTSNAGYLFSTGDSPFEVFLNDKYYCDVHYPNSTTAATVNTSDYDKRDDWPIERAFNIQLHPNTKYTFQYYNTPIYYFRALLNGKQVLSTAMSSTGNKDYCTTEEYKLNVSTYNLRSNWGYISDIRVYDNNGTVIHEWRLYPNEDSYAYYDMVTQEWTTLNAGTFNDVVQTDR